MLKTKHTLKCTIILAYKPSPLSLLAFGSFLEFDFSIFSPIHNPTGFNRLVHINKEGRVRPLTCNGARAVAKPAHTRS